MAMTSWLWIALYRAFSPFGAKVPGLGRLVGVEDCAGFGFADELDVVCRMPVPGIPTVLVVRPDVDLEIRAPFTPPDTDIPDFDTVIRTPGMTLIDFRY